MCANLHRSHELKQLSQNACAAFETLNSFILMPDACTNLWLLRRFSDIFTKHFRTRCKQTTSQFLINLPVNFLGNLVPCHTSFTHNMKNVISLKVRILGSNLFLTRLYSPKLFQSRSHIPILPGRYYMIMCARMHEGQIYLHC
jgi:hypothetical protein